jgi:hypothetical protein
MFYKLYSEKRKEKEFVLKEVNRKKIILFV